MKPKKSTSPVLLRPIFFLSLFFTMAAGQFVSAEDNVFAPGEISALNAEEFSSSWTIESESITNITLDGGGKNKCIKIESKNTNAPINMGAVLKLDPAWKKLLVTVRFRVSDLKIGVEAWHRPRIALRFTDEKSAGIGYYEGYPDRQPQLEKSSNEWIVQKEEFLVPDGSVYLVVQPGLYFCSGTFEIASISVEPVKASSKAP